MGKGKRNRERKQAQRAWSVTAAGRDALAWRRQLRADLEQSDHDERELAQHLQRLRHAGTVMHEHVSDLSDTFEAAWISFVRPLIRLGFAAGMQTRHIQWHHPTREGLRHAQKDAVTFARAAIAADRTCDLAGLDGPVFVVSPEIHAVIAACAATLSPREAGEAFAAADLPALSGMLALPDRAPWVEAPHTRAVLWHYVPQMDWNTADEQPVPSMRIKPYLHASVIDHLRIPEAHVGVAADKRNALFYATGRQVMPCLGDLTSQRAEEFTAWLSELADKRLEYDDYLQHADDISAEADRAPRGAEAGGEESDVEVGEARLDVDSGTPLNLTRYVAAFVRICEQQLVVAEPASSDPRSAATGEDHHASDRLRIVRLRRAVAASDDNDGRPVTWSHRWVVRMHKVRQWYPSQNRHKTIWRGPYIKGPGGAPLKDSSDTIHALTR